MARWFLHASLFGALKAGAGGCDCPCVWTMLLCGPSSLCCSCGMDYDDDDDDFTPDVNDDTMSVAIWKAG
jgi:hypothetical protein